MALSLFREEECEYFDDASTPHMDLDLRVEHRLYDSSTLPLI